MAKQICKISHRASPRRRRQRSPGEEELLDRVFGVFVETGYEGASVDRIAATVGVTKRTLYLRHGDKESLFRAALSQAIERFVVPAAQLREAEGDDLHATLLAIGRLLVDNILSPSGLRLLHLTNSIALRMPELAAFNVYQGVASTMEFLTDLIERRIGERLVCYESANDAANAFINLVVCGPATWIAQGVLLDPQFVDRYVEGSVAMFLRGVCQQQQAGDGTLRAENERLKVLLAEAVMQIDRLTRAHKDEAGDLGTFAHVLPGRRGKSD